LPLLERISDAPFAEDAGPTHNPKAERALTPKEEGYENFKNMGNMISQRRWKARQLQSQDQQYQQQGSRRGSLARHEG